MASLEGIGNQQSAPWLQIPEQAFEAAWKLSIPLVPVVSPWAGVKFKGELTPFEERRKSPVGFEQSLLFTGGDI